MAFFTGLLLIKEIKDFTLTHSHRAVHKTWWVETDVMSVKKNLIRKKKKKDTYINELKNEQ